MMPYSIPLCTILTKWPAPLGPQCRYPRSAGPAMLSRPGGGARVPRAPRGAGDGAAAGSQLREDRIEVLDHRRLAADHQAVPPLPSPDAAAGSDVHVVDALLGELPGAPDVVDVIGIAAAEEDVARREVRDEIVDRRVHATRRA